MAAWGCVIRGGAMVNCGVRVFVGVALFWVWGIGDGVLKKQVGDFFKCFFDVAVNVQAGHGGLGHVFRVGVDMH